MPSPFPGMDPYLEGSLWSDLHGALLWAIRAELTRLLPSRYAALVGQHVWLEGADDGDRTLLGVPDIHIPRQNGSATGTSLVPSIAPAITTLPSIRRTGHRYLRITDRDLRRVVTVLELLSPSNKDSGKNRPNYLAKREEYLATNVNLVELDLLRAGERMPLGDPAPTPSDYYIFVARSSTFPKAEVWPFSVRDPFPTLTIPLEDPDLACVVDLKRCFDRCYDESPYARLLDYRKPPSTTLREPDATWAAALLGQIPQR